LKAALGATLVQPVLFSLWFIVPGHFAAFPLASNWIFVALVAALVIGAAGVALLGIPAFLVLRRFNMASAGRIMAAGVLLGSLPAAIIGWPYRFHGYSSAGNWFGHYVQFYVDGVPTFYGWLSYAQGLALFGIHGLVGAFTFYRVWSRQ
jgi:hypothetical protein